MFNRIINYVNYLYYIFLINTNFLIRKQRQNPLSIPIIIINFNQLFYLNKLVEFLLNRKFENIVIIDNNSTYSPLLDYYKEIESKVTIEYMNVNLGHMAFFESEYLQSKYGNGYYVVTDADIVPNENLPLDFMRIMIKYLDKYYRAVNKIGFALKIDDIPNHFPLKEKVLLWEKRHWELELSKDVFKAETDTTFALYKPMYPKLFDNIFFLKGIRLGGEFTCKHGGWYKDPNNLTQEELFYQKTANSSSSWNFDKDNKVLGNINY